MKLRVAAARTAAPATRRRVTIGKVCAARLLMGIRAGTDDLRSGAPDPWGMTTMRIPTGASLRLLDAVRDGLLALVVVLAMAFLAGVVIAVSTLGPLDPSVPGTGTPRPSAPAAPPAPHD